MTNKNFKKTSLIGAILFVQFIGLVILNQNLEFLENLKYPMASNYAVVMAEKNISSWFTNLFGKNQAVTASASNMESDSGFAKSIPVLLYHGVVAKPDLANVTVEEFTDQMHALKNDGYNTITLADFNDFIQGKKQLPRKSFLLTFDDGRKDSFYPVDPVLKDLNYTAVIFIITSRSAVQSEHGNSFHMTPSELKLMSNTGRWELESHTKNGHAFYVIDANNRQGHYLSNKLLKADGQVETNEEYKNRIQEDLSASNKEIEAITKTKVYAFAYPFGDYGYNSLNSPESSQIIDQVVGSLYQLTFMQSPEDLNYTQNYPTLDTSKYYLARRINVDPLWTSSELLQLLKTGQAKTLPFEDNFSSYQGWNKVWGNLVYKNSLATLNSKDSTGAEAFLDGTYNLDNYKYDLTINKFQGDTVSLLSDYHDDQNNVACDFGQDQVSLRLRQNDKDSLIAQKSLPTAITQGEHILSMTKNGQAYSCSIDNNQVVSNVQISASHSLGSLGIKIFGSSLDLTQVLIK